MVQGTGARETSERRPARRKFRAGFGVPSQGGNSFGHEGLEVGLWAGAQLPSSNHERRCDLPPELGPVVDSHDMRPNVACRDCRQLSEQWVCIVGTVCDSCREVSVEPEHRRCREARNYGWKDAGAIAANDFDAVHHMVSVRGGRNIRHRRDPGVHRSSWMVPNGNIVCRRCSMERRCSTTGTFDSPAAIFWC